MCDNLPLWDLDKDAGGEKSDIHREISLNQSFKEAFSDALYQWTSVGITILLAFLHFVCQLCLPCYKGAMYRRWPYTLLCLVISTIGVLVNIIMGMCTWEAPWKTHLLVCFSNCFHMISFALSALSPIQPPALSCNHQRPAQDARRLRRRRLVLAFRTLLRCRLAHCSGKDIE